MSCRGEDGYESRMTSQTETVRRINESLFKVKMRGMPSIFASSVGSYVEPVIARCREHRKLVSLRSGY